MSHSYSGSNIDDRFLEEYIKRQQSKKSGYGHTPLTPSESRSGNESKQAQMKLAGPLERQYGGAFVDSVDSQQTSVMIASQKKSGFKYRPATLSSGYTVTGT